VLRLYCCSVKALLCPRRSVVVGLRARRVFEGSVEALRRSCCGSVKALSTLC
jgi:hypothetical protein